MWKKIRLSVKSQKKKKIFKFYFLHLHQPVTKFISHLNLGLNMDLVVACQIAGSYRLCTVQCQHAPALSHLTNTYHNTIRMHNRPLPITTPYGQFTMLCSRPYKIELSRIFYVLKLSLKEVNVLCYVIQGVG